MTTSTRGGNTPSLSASQPRHTRLPLPIGGLGGIPLLIVGAFLVLAGVVIGPAFIDTHTVLPWWDSAMQSFGFFLVAGIPWGILLASVGLVSWRSSQWLRTRYPGRLDFKTDLRVRLHDELGPILHPGDCVLEVHRGHGLYQVLIRLRATGLQYDAKRDAVVKAIVGMGFTPPEITPYHGHKAYDLDVLVVSRLVTDGYYARWETLIDSLRAWWKRVCRK